MSDAVYDVLSRLQRWLPALGAFYLGISRVWTLPYGDAVNETVALAATLLAATLEIAAVQYERSMSE